MNLQKLIASDKFYVLADQIVVSGAAFVSNLLLARALGISEYGRFAGVGLVQLFALSLFMATGSQVFQVVYPTLHSNRKKEYTTGIFYFLVTIVLVAALFAFSLFFLPIELLAPYKKMAGWSVLAIGLYLLQDFLRKALITAAREKQAFYADLITNTLQLILLLVLWQIQRLNASTAWMVIGLTFIPSIIVSIFWLGIGLPSKKSILVVLILHKGKSSWLIMSALLQWCSGYFFVMAAGWWISAAALGALRLAQYIYGLLNVLLQAIENYSLPKLVQAADKKVYLQNLIKRLSSLIFPLLAVLAIFAEPILSIAGGESYRGYGYVMYGLSVVYVFITLGYPVRMAIRAAHLNQQFFTGYVLSVLFSVGSAAFLIKNWQLYGVITGLLITQLINICYWAYVLKSRFQPDVLQSKKLSS